MDDARRLKSAVHLARRVVPILLIGIGFYLMTGCFYLPTPEHQTGPPQKDFRALVGDRNSKKVIRPGAITRTQVIKILGAPPYASSDQHAIVYTMQTDRAVWTYPLCLFYSTPAVQRGYTLRLVFDEFDVLRRWDIVHADVKVNALLHATNGATDEAMRQMNSTEPQLLDRATQPATVPHR